MTSSTPQRSFCDGRKNEYDSRDHALSDAGQMGRKHGRPFSVYWCRPCGAFHVGSVDVDGRRMRKTMRKAEKAARARRRRMTVKLVDGDGIARRLSEVESAPGSSDAPVSVFNAEPVIGRKDDAGKPTFRLVPPRALLEVARVLEFGARKYDPENWRRVDGIQDRYLDAALRHINAHQRGEDADRETGISHLAHAGCCLLFMLEDALLKEHTS